jgi:hypothetical protein
MVLVRKPLRPARLLYLTELRPVRVGREEGAFIMRLL